MVENTPPREGSRYKLAQMLGLLDKKTRICADIEKQEKSNFCYDKWKDVMLAPFDINSHCCDVMKKSPSHSYEKRTGKVPMTAQMASESVRRAQTWMKFGCNAFETTRPISNPMSFWTEQDVLLYIKAYNKPYCCVYGDIVTEDGSDIPEGAVSAGLLDLERPLLHTTGYNRTGCMFCGFGAHLEKSGEGRFLKMKETHPKQYEYIMKSVEDGGLGYRAVIDWMNENTGTKIEY